MKENRAVLRLIISFNFSPRKPCSFLQTLEGKYKRKRIGTYLEHRQKEHADNRCQENPFLSAKLLTKNLKSLSLTQLLETHESGSVRQE
jgi:hypothetical protein